MKAWVSRSSRKLNINRGNNLLLNEVAGASPRAHTQDLALLHVILRGRLTEKLAIYQYYVALLLQFELTAAALVQVLVIPA